MSSVKELVYIPREENRKKYEKLYSIYCSFSGIMGDDSRELLQRLRNMKE